MKVGGTGRQHVEPGSQFNEAASLLLVKTLVESLHPVAAKRSEALQRVTRSLVLVGLFEIPIGMRPD